MDNLIKLKNIILDLMVSLAVREEMTGILKLILDTHTKPLIEIKPAHDVFLSQTTESSDLFDKWLSIQVQVLTELGGMRYDVASDLHKLLSEISDSCGVTTLLDLKQDGFQNTSLFVLTAIRVYAPLLEVGEELKNESRN